jgi:hypothetical protein
MIETNSRGLTPSFCADAIIDGISLQAVLTCLSGKPEFIIAKQIASP